MRKIRRFLQSKYKSYISYNFYNQLWYNYHHVFFCSLIFRGRKLSAFFFFLKLKKYLKIKEESDPFLIFLVAMLRITPNIILLPLKKGGALQGIPFPISEKKKITFATKWVIKLLKDVSRSVKVSTIGDLLVSAIYNRGNSIKKKREIYTQALRTRHLVKFFR